MKRFLQPAVRSLSTTSGRMSKDAPQFYAMVKEFSSDGAAILKNKLLAESAAQPELGRSETTRKEQLKGNGTQI